MACTPPVTLAIAGKEHTKQMLRRSAKADAAKDAKADAAKDAKLDLRGKKP